MGTITLAKRTRLIRGKRGSGFATLVYEIPEDIAIQMPEASQIARDCASTLLEQLRSNLRRGVDAAGVSHAIGDSTARARRHDVKPPKNPRSGGTSVNVSKRKSKWGVEYHSLGKAKETASRWQARYPDGRGSLGGSTFFMDSGYLVDNLRMRMEGGFAGYTAQAYVDVPSARVAAVLAIETGKRKGSKGPIPIIGVGPDHIERHAAAAVDSAIGSFGGGGGGDIRQAIRSAMASVREKLTEGS